MNVELQKQLGDKHEYTNMFQFCLPPTVLFVVPSSRETVRVTCALEKNTVRRIQYCTALKWSVSLARLYRNCSLSRTAVSMLCNLKTGRECKSRIQNVLDMF